MTSCTVTGSAVAELADIFSQTEKETFECSDSNRQCQQENRFFSCPSEAPVVPTCLKSSHFSKYFIGSGWTEAAGDGLGANYC